MLYRGALRITEALALRPKDIDLTAGTIRVLHGKGDKARTVGVDDGTLSLLQIWLDTRKGLGKDGRHPLFTVLRGNHAMSGQACRALLHRLGEKVGIEKRCNPHSLRHSGACFWEASGVKINEISRRLGHATVEGTIRYLGPLSKVAQYVPSGMWC